MPKLFKPLLLPIIALVLIQVLSCSHIRFNKQYAYMNLSLCNEIDSVHVIELYGTNHRVAALFAVGNYSDKLIIVIVKDDKKDINITESNIEIIKTDYDYEGFRKGEDTALLAFKKRHPRKHIKNYNKLKADIINRQLEFKISDHSGNTYAFSVIVNEEELLHKFNLE